MQEYVSELFRDAPVSGVAARGEFSPRQVLARTLPSSSQIAV